MSRVKAEDMMIRDVYKVDEHATVKDVIELFMIHRISGLPVVGGQGEILAYISDGDIMRFIGKHQDIIIDSILTVGVIAGDDKNFDERVQNVLGLNVLAIAQRKIIIVNAGCAAEEVAAILGKKRIKKLPVEKDGKLVGIISRGDVIRHAFKRFL